MNAIAHIRKELFKVSQASFGEIAGTTQASVSRWEADELQPDRSEMERIRNEALARDLPWNDALFFQTPRTPEPVRA